MQSRETFQISKLVGTKIKVVQQQIVNFFSCHLEKKGRGQIEWRAGRRRGDIEDSLSSFYCWFGETSASCVRWAHSSWSSSFSIFCFQTRSKIYFFQKIIFFFCSSSVKNCKIIPNRRNKIEFTRETFLGTYLWRAPFYWSCLHYNW